MFALLRKHEMITDHIQEQAEQVEELEFICISLNNILDSELKVTLAAPVVFNQSHILLLFTEWLTVTFGAFHEAKALDKRVY